MHDRPSATRRKRYGDSGSPCLKPLVGVIVFVSTELN